MQDDDVERVAPPGVDEYVISNLPATFQSLVQRSPDADAWYRPIDRSLQRLRKAGRVTFDRDGRRIVWRAIGAP